MKHFDITRTQLQDTAADSVTNRAAEEAALESHLLALEEQLATLERIGADRQQLAELQLQQARTLVGLGRGEDAWPLGRRAFDAFIEAEAFESAADCCDVLFRAEQEQSLSALGQGIWLAVTYPMDVELSIELLSHVVDETPDDADGAAVAATTALVPRRRSRRRRTAREPELLRIADPRRRRASPQRRRVARGIRPLAGSPRAARA
jgi:hypothetical protein